MPPLGRGPVARSTLPSWWCVVIVVPVIGALVYLAAIHSPFFLSGLITSIGAAVLTAGALWLLPATNALHSVNVARPRREAMVMLIFAVLWAAVFLSWGFTQVVALAPAG